MAYVTETGLRSALSQFLNNLVAWLPIKGFTTNSKSKQDTLTVQNEGEIAMGYHNESSADTLVSVGNGVEGAPKNAFEITKDGSVYVMNGSDKVKLQDEITISIPEEEINNLK
jgi:hypothetical protein